MARIVLGVWTTHGPQLSTTPEQWMLRVPMDKSRLHWFKGRCYSFDELLELRKREGLAEFTTLESRTERHARCQAAIDRLARVWAEIEPDCCVIIGNDQRELVLSSLQPTYTIYYGETFWNAPLSERRRARRLPGIGEADCAIRPDRYTTYRGLPELAQQLIAAGIDAGWDFAVSDSWPEHHLDHHHAGTPHAFAFILRRVMLDRAVPTLPIIINTFFPPNQPRPWRCFELGKLLHRVVSEWNEDRRVAIVGSGGMTHFIINEELDVRMIEAIQSRDEYYLRNIDPDLMRDGTSELLNWIAASGCLFQTDLCGDLIDYVPCYRTAAGSGTAQGFIAWS